MRVKRGGARPAVLIGYHRPPYSHTDQPVYDVLAGLMSDGFGARLRRALKGGEALAERALASAIAPGKKLPTQFVFTALAAPGCSADKLKSALGAEIDELRAHPVGDDELAGARSRAEAMFLRSLADGPRAADLLAAHEVLCGGWRVLATHLQRLAAVTPSDILRVAQGTFTEDRKTTAILEPA